MSRKLVGSIVAGAGVLLLLLGLGTAAPEEEKGKPLGKVPADIALVPPESSAFVTVRLSELAAQPLVALLSAVGREDVLARFEKDFRIAPSNVERLTLFASPEGAGVTVVRTRKPYSRERLVGKREEQTVHGKKVYGTTRRISSKDKDVFRDKDSEGGPRELDPYGLVVWPVDAQTFVEGNTRAMDRYLGGLKRPAKGHALADELALAGKHTIVIGVRPRRWFQQQDLARRQQMRDWEEMRRRSAKDKESWGKDKGSRDEEKGRSDKDKEGRGAEKDKAASAEKEKGSAEKDKAVSAPRARKAADKEGRDKEGRERPADKPAPLEMRSVEEILESDFRDMESLAFKPLIQPSRVLVTADVGAEVRGTAQLQYLREEDAMDGVPAVQMALYTAREAVPILFREAGLDPKEKQVSGVIKALQTGIRGAAVERDGTTVKASLKVKVPVDAALSARLRDAASVRQAENNLKQIVLALHNYHAANGHFPASAIVDKDGKPLLSWRVAILPFLEEDALYREFKLNEAWDSEHNRKLLDRIPKVYAPVGGKGEDPGTTFWQVFTGPNTPFPSLSERNGPRISTFTDGFSNTFLVAEGSKGVPWTRPQDLAVEPRKPLPRLGAQFERFALVAFADGSVMRIRKDADEKVLRLFIDPRDGEVTDPRDLRPR